MNQRYLEQVMKNKVYIIDKNKADAEWELYKLNMIQKDFLGNPIFTYNVNNKRFKGTYKK